MRYHLQMKALVILAVVAASRLAHASDPERPITKRTDRGVRYDVVCPSSTGPRPLILVAPDIDQPLAQVTMSTWLAETGFVVIVVDPPREGQSYVERLEAVLAAARLDCRPSGAVGAWGSGWGGIAVLELARRREAANAPLAGVIAFLVSETGAPLPQTTTPALVIDTVKASAQRTLVVAGATSCDLRLGGCTPHRHPAIETSWPWRMHLVETHTRQFLHAYVGGRSELRAAIDAWDLAPKPEAPAPSQPRPRDPLRKLFSLPLLVGGTNEGDGGFAIGGRPEAILAWRDRYGLGRGVGAFGEVIGANGHLVVGAGLTYVSYFGRIGLAPSLGLYHRTTGTTGDRDNGAVAGVFVGLRSPITEEDLGIDVPYGIRVDTHFGFGGARDVMITAQLDTSLLIIGAAALYATLTTAHHD